MNTNANPNAPKESGKTPAKPLGRVLIAAGSDSGGGAGIQADIKAVSALGGHAMTAITAITAQNTLGVRAVHGVPVDMVLAQIDAVVADIGVDAVKIGMIGSAETANAVADRLEALVAQMPSMRSPTVSPLYGEQGVAVKVAVPKNGTNPNFGMNMPMMCSAFDTSMWLSAA